MPSQRSDSSSSSSPRDPSRHAPELIDPRWVLKAFFATLAVALACAYLLLCVIFYSQQWQLALHPSRIVAHSPSALSLTFQEVHFSPDAEGKPQLDGWWIPADLPTDPTALVLHGGDGSMSDALPLARTLHDARMNVLLFDYRGFGRSAGQHPAEKTMEADSRAALKWLLETQRVPAAQIVVVGDHLGASPAVQLCAHHPELAGLILQQGYGDLASRARMDRRSRIVPFNLLFHEDFPLADALHTLKTPKLLISYTDASPPVDAQRAADPKLTVEIPHASDASAVHEAMRRFLGIYLTQPPQELKPKA